MRIGSRKFRQMSLFAFAIRFFEITDVFSKVCYHPILSVGRVVDERGATTDRKQCIERTTPLFQLSEFRRETIVPTTTIYNTAKALLCE